MKLEMLMEIRKKPGMYLGICTLDRLDAYIAGYNTCLREFGVDTNWKLFEDFYIFVRDKYKVMKSLNTYSIVESMYEDKREAFEKYFELLDEFLELKRNLE